MLLNQCLAISLSPSLSTGEHQAGQAEAAKGREFQGGNRRTEEVTGAARESSALELFHQLIKRNSCNLEEKEVEADGGAEFTTKVAQAQQDQRPALPEALGRVEFAGFVVPGWLLLSGSFNDLHCIKSSWFEGKFEPPAGFKIETIGKWI